MQSISNIIRKLKTNKEEYADFESRGLVKLTVGSYWTWMHLTWLQKALEEEVLFQNTYGQFIPVCRVVKVRKPVGKRGRETLYEDSDKESLNYDAFINFCERYDKFCQQQKHVDEEMEGLVHQ